jgi:hypothetical protein
MFTPDFVIGNAFRLSGDDIPKPDVEEIEFEGEEYLLAEAIKNLGGRRRQLLKCRSNKARNGYYYLLLDENGGYWFETIGELKEFVES